GYSLTVSGGALVSTTTNAVTVTAATVTQWVVTTQPPASVSAGSSFSLAVAAEDGFGNVNTTYSGNVSLALAANPGGGTLGGVLTGAANAGIMTFTGLSLNRTAAGYTLQVSGGSLSAATTDSITILAPSIATQWVVTMQPPASATAGSGFNLTVAAEDTFG